MICMINDSENILSIYELTVDANPDLDFLEAFN